MRTRFVRNLNDLSRLCTHTHTHFCCPRWPGTMNWALACWRKFWLRSGILAVFSGHQYGVKILFVTQHTTAVLLKGRSARSNRLHFQSCLKDSTYKAIGFRSINLISASPSDRGLLDALSQGVLPACLSIFRCERQDIGMWKDEESFWIKRKVMNGQTREDCEIKTCLRWKSDGCLGSQAVASVAAEQTETAARGAAKWDYLSEI